MNAITCLTFFININPPLTIINFPLILYHPPPTLHLSLSLSRLLLSHNIMTIIYLLTNHRISLQHYQLSFPLNQILHVHSITTLPIIPPHLQPLQILHNPQSPMYNMLIILNHLKTMIFFWAVSSLDSTECGTLNFALKIFLSIDTILI